MVEKTKNNLKTMTYINKNKNHSKIIGEMTYWSKNIYNSSMYNYSIYKKYKNDIYAELCEYIKGLKIYEQLIDYLKNKDYEEDFKKEKDKLQPSNSYKKYKR